MKNLTKRSLSLLLALVIFIGLLSGLTFTVSAADVDYVYSGNYIYNWGTREETATFLSPNAVSFYEDNNVTYEELASLSGSSTLSAVPSSALYKKLQSLMSSAHKWQTNYNDTRPLYQYTDCQQSGEWNNGKISSFYSGKAIGPAWDGGGTWNREHTWPNSKGLAGKDEDDIMMLRPTAVSENSDRGNTAYGESSSFYDPNQESGGKYNLHGDVARIMLYVYVRWGNTQTMWGFSGVMESKEVLLKWMEEDPVDTWELGRNDSVESMTGTRNVFVDYPELAFVLLDEVIPADMQTPSGEAAKYDFHVSAVSNNDAYGTVSLNGLTITANPADGYVVEGYTVLNGTANVVQNGKTFNVSPKSDCTIQINFAPKSSCTVQFVENGKITATMTPYTGDTVTMPQSTVAVDGYTFMGWSAVEVDSTSQKPSYYAAGSKYEITGNTTFYALYTYGVADTGNVFEKVTAAPSNWEGEYVLTASDSGTNYVFVADGTDPGSGAAVREFSVAGLTTEGNVLKGVTDQYVIIIEKVGTNYSMRLKGASTTKYLMTTNANSGFSTATSTSNSNARWNLSYSSSKVVIRNAAYTSRILQYNAGNALFRTYTSSQTPVVLYKRSGTATEDFYSTLSGVTACNHENTITTTVDATCTATGTETISCGNCGEILETKTIAALGHAYQGTITTAPTCVDKGVKTFVCANDASHIYKTPIPATGEHTYVTYTEEPTCTTAGFTAKVCDVCGERTDESEIPATGHSYVDGVCSSCGEADPNARELIKWVGTQLQATSNLDMQFALRISDLEGTTGNYIVLTRYFAQGDTPAEEIVIDQVDWTESNGFYIVAYSGIAAKEMNDMISAVVYNADGEVISETRSESIVTYALSMLGKITNEEQKTMFVDLLNYGAEAQKFFHYNESNLANAGLTEAQKALGTQGDIEVADHRVKGENFVGSQLSLENVILLQMAFKVTPVEGMYAVVTYTDHNGKSVSNTLAVENNAGFTMVSVNSLAIADYRTLVTCTVYNADGEIVGSAVDSMESYVARSGNDLGAAIMRFGASAYAYFH